MLSIIIKWVGCQEISGVDPTGIEPAWLSLVILAVPINRAHLGENYTQSGRFGKQITYKKGKLLALPATRG